MEKMMRSTQSRIALHPMLWDLFGVGSACTKPVNDYFNEIVKTVIAQKRALKESGKTIEKKHMDILDRLLDTDASSGADYFSDEEIRDEIFGFFLAGHETTANSLTMLLMELCQNDRVLRKVQDEIDSILEPTDELTFESLSKFKYLDMTIKEAMRIYPVISQNGRVAIKDVELDGKKFPVGTRMIISARALHMNPQYWPEPEDFKPERWIDMTPVPGSYIPFGDGPTNCIGQKLALLEMKVLMIELLRSFNVALVPGQELRLIGSVTIGLKMGLEVEFTERV